MVLVVVVCGCVDGSGLWRSIAPGVPHATEGEHVGAREAWGMGHVCRNGLTDVRAIFELCWMLCS